MLKPGRDFSAGVFIGRSAALVGAKAVQDILTSLLFIWLARLNPSGYGLIVLGLSAAMLLRSLQSMGMDQYTLRELSGPYSEKGPLLMKMAWLKLGIAAAVIAVFLCFAFFRQWPLLQVCVVCMLLIGQGLEGVSDTFFNMLRAEGRSINESICKTVPSVAAVVYGGSCLLLSPDIFLFALMFPAGSILKLGFAVYSARRLCFFQLFSNTSGKLDTRAIQALIAISAVGFLGTFFNEIQIFWLKNYHTLIDVAYYRVAFDVTTFVCGAFSQLVVGAVLFPRLARAFSSGADSGFLELVSSCLRRLVEVGSGLAVFLAVFGGLLVSVVYGSQYLKAQALVPLFGIAAFFSFINNFITYVLLAMRAERTLVVLLLLPAGISVLLGPTVVAASGSFGAACSLLLSRCVLTLVLVIMLQKRLRFFALRDYRTVLLCWLAALLVYGVGAAFLPLIYAGGAALALYSLLLIAARRRL